MAKSPHETVVSKKLDNIQDKVKTSFILIRQDIDEMQKTVNAMRDYLKNKDRQFQYARKEDNKIRDKFRTNVDEFTQKVTQLKLALSEVRTIKNEVVLARDLAKIEEKIKTSFKNEIEEYKEKVEGLKDKIKEMEKRIKPLENPKTKKEKFWSLGKKSKN